MSNAGRITALAAILLMSAFDAVAEDIPVAAQARAWAKCRACHSTDAGASRNEGPTLHAIFGAPAAGQTDFKNYSSALLKSGIVWTEETLDKFLIKPSQFVPDNTMPFAGMPRHEERAAVVAYLKARAE